MVCSKTNVDLRNGGGTLVLSGSTTETESSELCAGPGHAGVLAAENSSSNTGKYSLYHEDQVYRVANLLANLSFVDFDLCCYTLYSAWADGKLAEVAEQVGKMAEHPKFKFNQIQVSQEMGQLVTSQVSSLIWCGLVFEFWVHFFCCRNQNVNQD